MIDKFLRGVANALNGTADYLDISDEEKVAKTIMRAQFKNEELYGPIRKFEDRWNMGIEHIFVEPVLEKGSMNILSWKARRNGKSFIEGKIEDIINYFIVGATTDKPDILEIYKNDLLRVIGYYWWDGEFYSKYQDYKKEVDLITESKENKTISIADEIIKFKSLLDSGVITQGEFDIKKKQLLDL